MRKELWFWYFTSYLFDKGIIDADKKRMLEDKISSIAVYNNSTA